MLPVLALSYNDCFSQITKNVLDAVGNFSVVGILGYLFEWRFRILATVGLFKVT